MLKHLILVTLLFQFIFSLNCDSFDGDKKKNCIIAKKIKQFYDILNEECISNKLCFQFRLKKFALSLQPEIKLNDNYEAIIEEESKKYQIYVSLYQSKFYKGFFDLIKEFIRNIEMPTNITNRARGTTHDDEYIKTVCEFFISLFGLDKSYCDE